MAWIDLDGVANLRDVGGLPTTDGGATVAGRLLRSDNLQDLSPTDVATLLGLGLTDVVDLRSDYERAATGPGPLSATGVTIHPLSMFREEQPGVGEDKPDVRPEVLPEQALPWVDLEPSVDLDNRIASVYFSYLVDRPDSVVAALRAIAYAPGTALVHCAAGKDRTGTVVALALTLAGVDRDAVVADYVASSERVEPVLARLLATPAYVENLRDRPLESHLSRPESITGLLDHIDVAYGGVDRLLARHRWTAEDTAALRRKLRD